MHDKSSVPHDTNPRLRKVQTRILYERNMLAFIHMSSIIQLNVDTSKLAWKLCQIRLEGKAAPEGLAFNTNPDLRVPGSIND